MYIEDYDELRAFIDKLEGCFIMFPERTDLIELHASLVKHKEALKKFADEMRWKE